MIILYALRKTKQTSMECIFNKIILIYIEKSKFSRTQFNCSVCVSDGQWNLNVTVFFYNSLHFKWVRWRAIIPITLFVTTFLLKWLIFFPYNLPERRQIMLNEAQRLIFTLTPTTKCIQWEKDDEKHKHEQSLILSNEGFNFF